MVWFGRFGLVRLVGEVKEAVLKSGIKWQEIDYLEGARYVALNWSEQQCRSSGLRRILPWRRGTRGSRPGLRGAGPYSSRTYNCEFIGYKL